MDARVAEAGDPRNLDTALSGPLLGSYWRYRVGDGRINCDIHDGTLIIFVIEVGDRKDVYRA